MNKKYHLARVAQWGFKPRQMGTYRGEYIAEMVWYLHTDDNHPGYYSITNCSHISLISKWGKADDEVGVDMGARLTISFGNSTSNKTASITSTISSILMPAWQNGVPKIAPGELMLEISMRTSCGSLCHDSTQM